MPSEHYEVILEHITLMEDALAEFDDCYAEVEATGNADLVRLFTRSCTTVETLLEIHRQQVGLFDTEVGDGRTVDDVVMQIQANAEAADLLAAANARLNNEIERLIKDKEGLDKHDE